MTLNKCTAYITWNKGRVHGQQVKKMYKIEMVSGVQISVKIICVHFTVI